MNKFFCFSILFLVLVSCKKYDGDKSFSTYTVKGRLAGGVWNCTKIVNLNNAIVNEIPRFSCLLDFNKDDQFEIMNTTTIGVFNIETKDFQWKSNKDIIVINGIDFEIKSLSWKSFVIKSIVSNKEYYFEKWINLDVNGVTRDDIFYPFPVIE